MPTNTELVDGIFLENTTDYQQRIPLASQAGFSATTEALLNPANRTWFNEFQGALLNRVGSNIVHNKLWNNPFKPFKRGLFTNGAHIQEITTNLIKARGYDREANFDVLKNFYPETATAYHSINREDTYPLTMREDDLKRAFLGAGDGNSLEDYLTSLLSKPMTSDEVDEYHIMLNLFVEYHARVGYRTFEAPDLLTLEAQTADASGFAKLIRNLVSKMAFPTNEYNGHRFPTWSQKSDMVLVVPPEVNSNLDIELLAWAFHTTRADVEESVRIVEVDEIPIKNVQALLMDDAHIVCADTELETLVTDVNAFTKNKTSVLHHSGIYSVSPFINAVAITTDDETIFVPVNVSLDDDVEITYSEMWIKGEKVTPTYVERGKYVQLQAVVNGTVDPEGVGVEVPGAVTWEIIGSEKPRMARTYIRQNGTLVCDENERSDWLAVKATTTYVDPTAIKAERKYYSAILFVGVDAAQDQDDVSLPDFSDDGGDDAGEE